MEFGRTGPNEWQIVKPKPMRADSFQVEDFLGRLKDAEMDPALSDETRSNMPLHSPPRPLRPR